MIPSHHPWKCLGEEKNVEAWKALNQLIFCHKTFHIFQSSLWCGRRREGASAEIARVAAGEPQGERISEEDDDENWY